MSLFVTRLARHHRLETFDSGRIELDTLLRLRARTNEVRYNTGAVWVLCDTEVERGESPIGYYSLSAHAVAYDDLIERGLPQSGQWPDPVPAVLLGRLAVHKAWQGRALGTQLLRDAVEKTIAMQQHVHAVLLVVDALDEHAASFYAHRGFVPITERRLVARIKDLAHTLAPRKP